MTTQDKHSDRTFGIVLYDIELNGCLNGVFTNVPLDGFIYNEIAKIKGGVQGDSLCGTYDCFYFDRPTLRNNVELEISLGGSLGTFTFVWTDLVNGRPILFRGIGFLMNKKQIAVNYWPV